jgi:polar amino acid transport system substrate-binding protein
MTTCVRWMVAVLAGVLGLSAYAEPAICPEPIKVALYDIGPFYNPVSGQGIDRDLIDELQRRTHCRFETTFESRVRIWGMLENGSLAMSVSGYATDERRKFADFASYYRTRYELVMTTVGPASPEAFLADDSLKLGVVHGYRHGPGWDEWILALRQRGRVVDVADVTTQYRLLDIGRIHAMPDLTTNFAAKVARYSTQHPVTHLRWFADRPAMELGLVMSKKALSPALRQIMTDNIAAMRRDGSLKKIFLRYYDEETANAAMLPP